MTDSTAQTPPPVRWSDRAVGYLRLPHAVPIVAVLLATAALAIAVGGWPPPWRLVPMLLAMLGGQIVVGVVNELIDLPADRATKPDKPIPSGLVSLRGARGALLFGLLLLIAAGGTIGPAGFALVALGNAIGVVYSIGFKRTAFAWVPYLIALPLLPIWVAVCLDAPAANLLWLYPLGAMGTLALYLAQSVPDIAADRAAGLRTLPVRLGERRALLAGWGGTLVSGAAVAAVGRWGTDTSAFLIGAGLAAMTAILVNALVWRIRPRRGVLLAFPMTAVAIGLLAVSWMIETTR